MCPGTFVHNRDENRRFFLFDMFSTLVENTKGTVEPIFETLCTYYPGVDPSLISWTYHGLSSTFKQIHKNRELSIDVLISHLDTVFGFDNDPDAMETPLLRGTDLYHPVENVESVLRYLRDRNYRIGVLSNTRYHSRTLKGMLEDCGISQYIDVVVASADIGIRKPDPLSYEAALHSLGCTASECYFAGDSLSKDYYGPLAVGFKGAIHIDLESAGDAKHRISKLAELPELFEN